MDVKKICLTLLDAQSEADVDKIIASVPEMADPKNWTPLDRRETNYNVTTNQQASGPKAATELMTNMVDAVLLKEARRAGIDPKGPKAPATMHDAVEQFLGLKGGRMLNADSDKWLSDFAAKNLVVGISGARSKAEGLPCYTFVDNGEGQNPEEFENTFLSLSSGNKKDVPFVQGKFNMGSSGVLSYCGERWYKLIVSRKWNSKGPWGWTILRRRPGGGMPVAEYFKPGGEKGKIPAADIETVFPLRNRKGDRYAACSLTTGTIVKLYDFHVGSKFMSFRGAREALNENLADTILPFRILDLRQTPDPSRGGDRALGVDARPFYGMEYLLRRTHKQEDGEVDGDDEAAAEDEKINVAVIDDPRLGRIEISALRLKRKLPAWLDEKNTNSRVFHTVNGQVQFKQTRGFLTTCKLPALKDRAVIIVDASNLDYAAHNDVWKADRENVRETGKGGLYKDLVREAIQGSEVLQNLQHQIAKEELQTAVDEKSNDLFQKLVEGDKSLAALLGARLPSLTIKGAAAKDASTSEKTSGKGKGGGKGGAAGHDEDEDKPFEGKYSPTYLTAEKRFKDKGLDLPINKSRPVSFETDVRNDYFVRDENQGELKISDTKIGTKFVIRRSLRDGRLTVYLNPVAEQVKVGDTFTFEVGLKDDAMPEAVSDEITIRITGVEKDIPKPPKGEPKKAKSGGGPEKPNVGLPPYRLLTHDGREDAGQQTVQWPEWMTDQDGGYVDDLGEGNKMYFINLDNTWLQSYRKAQRGQILKDGITQKYILGMRVFLLGVERAIKPLEDEEGFDADAFRKLAAKGASSTMLTLSDHLPKIITPVAEPE